MLHAGVNRDREDARCQRHGGNHGAPSASGGAGARGGRRPGSPCPRAGATTPSLRPSRRSRQWASSASVRRGAEARRHRPPRAAPAEEALPLGSSTSACGRPRWARNPSACTSTAPEASRMPGTSRRMAQTRRAAVRVGCHACRPQAQVAPGGSWAGVAGHSASRRVPPGGHDAVRCGPARRSWPGRSGHAPGAQPVDLGPGTRPGWLMTAAGAAAPAGALPPARPPRLAREITGERASRPRPRDPARWLLEAHHLNFSSRAGGQRASPAVTTAVCRAGPSSSSRRRTWRPGCASAWTPTSTRRWPPSAATARPCISGTETEIRDGELWIGSMLHGPEGSVTSSAIPGLRCTAARRTRPGGRATPSSPGTAEEITDPERVAQIIRRENAAGPLPPVSASTSTRSPRSASTRNAPRW